MKQALHILKEALVLVRQHKFYILLPLLIALALVAFLAYQLAPYAAVTFIYAGL